MPGQESPFMFLSFHVTAMPYHVIVLLYHVIDMLYIMLPTCLVMSLPCRIMLLTCPVADYPFSFLGCSLTLALRVLLTVLANMVWSICGLHSKRILVISCTEAGQGAAPCLSKDNIHCRSIFSSVIVNLCSLACFSVLATRL